MKRTAHHLAFYLIGVSLLCSCASSPASYYTLSAVEKTASAHFPSVSIAVGPVSIPDSIDRPQMVLQKGENKVTIDELNRWAASPREGIQRVVMENLSYLLGTSRVYRYPQGPTNSSGYRIEIEVLKFESTLGVDAYLDAIWTVRRVNGGEIKTGRTTSGQTAANESHEAMAAAHSRALGVLSRDLAQAVQSLEQKGA